jgi:hypothetical protein
MSASVAATDAEAPTMLPAKTSFATGGPWVDNPRCPTTAARGSEKQKAYEDTMSAPALNHLTCDATTNADNSAAIANMSSAPADKLACATRQE